ncbi:hypothetical protein B0H19DRAFT_1063473 [Mycena capillaripes]|nr:hypothetical protein B0H19DRAFT_1063473 [Mycena capillaripes]
MCPSSRGLLEWEQWDKQVEMPSVERRGMCMCAVVDELQAQYLLLVLVGEGKDNTKGKSLVDYVLYSITGAFMDANISRMLCLVEVSNIRRARAKDLGSDWSQTLQEWRSNKVAIGGQVREGVVNPCDRLGLHSYYFPHSSKLTMHMVVHIFRGPIEGSSSMLNSEEGSWLCSRCFSEENMGMGSHWRIHQHRSGGNKLLLEGPLVLLSLAWCFEPWFVVGKLYIGRVYGAGWVVECALVVAVVSVQEFAGSVKWRTKCLVIQMQYCGFPIR